MDRETGQTYRGVYAQSSSNGIEKLTQGLGWFSIGLGLSELLFPGALAKFIGADDRSKTRNVLRLYGLREIGAGLGILSRPDSATWVGSRVAGDLVDLASLGKAMASSDSDRWRVAASTAAVLGVTALDVYCTGKLAGSSASDRSKGRTRVSRVTLINRPPEELYRYWRDFRNLPRFMNNLESVEVTGDRRSHWKARIPGGVTVEWNAEIVKDEPNSRISWCSLPGSDVDNAGTVRFERAPGDRGTFVRVELDYAAPGGPVGSAAAKLFGAEPGQQIEGALRAFKQIIETGEVVKSDASMFRGMHPGQPPSREEMTSARRREGAESLKPSLV